MLLHVRAGIGAVANTCEMPLQHFRRGMIREVEEAQGGCEGSDRKKPLVGKMQKGLRMLVVLERLGQTLADVGVKQKLLGLCVGTGNLLAPAVPASLTSHWLFQSFGK